MAAAAPGPPGPPALGAPGPAGERGAGGAGEGKSPRRSLANELNDAGIVDEESDDDMDASPLDTKYTWEPPDPNSDTGDCIVGHMIDTKTRVIRKDTHFLQTGQGVPYHVVREVSILKGVNHPHVIRLLDVVHEFDSVSLIYEYLPRDLRCVLDEKLPIYEQGPATHPLQIKEYYRQMLCGVMFLHSQCILHRDLKPNDLRITDQNVIKITNFRLARTFSLPLRTYTHEVVTLWYRAPEILLGKKRYDTSVDMWSAGCLLAEITSGDALFRGDSEIDQLFQIYRVLGTPTKSEWPDIKDLPDYKASFPTWEPKALTEVVTGLDEQGESLLQQLLVYDSMHRATARQALQHPYFDDLHGWVAPTVRPPPNKRLPNVDWPA
eukprot:m.71404 g.71404  ORF g.71404 m.71404 type:complete len:379 (+) comp8705_c0_seq2:280-1416(+)